MPKYKTDNQIMPRCPYCGYFNDDWWQNYNDEIYSGDKLNIKCNACNCEYFCNYVQVERFYSYKHSK